MDWEINVVKKEYEEKQTARREKRSKINDQDKERLKEKSTRSKEDEEDKQDEKAKDDKVMKIP